MTNNRFNPAVESHAARDWRTSTHYECPELGRLCCRPGAYDAFDKPSLSAGGELRPYKFKNEGR